MRTQVDLAAFADALRQNYIYAAYPEAARGAGWFNRTLATVEPELSLVHGEAGYRTVLTDLAAAFQDAHVSIARATLLGQIVASSVRRASRYSVAALGLVIRSTSVPHATRSSRRD